MKKSSFVVLIMGTASGVLFALGMCMALLPEWSAFKEGIIFGAIGIVLSIITALIWCKMENKKLPKMSGKNLFPSLLLWYLAWVCVCALYGSKSFGAHSSVCLVSLC